MMFLKSGGKCVNYVVHQGSRMRAMHTQTPYVILTFTLLVCGLYKISQNLPTIDVRGQLDRYYVTMLYSCEKERYRMSSTHDGRFVCECFPDPQTTNIEQAITNADILDIRASQIQPGGLWIPSRCVPREKIAIIVPYRNREEHLPVFVRYMHRFLQQQQREYRIFIIEQKSPELFNRAALLNIGFLEAEKMGPFDCYIFHDVDLLPENSSNIYSCRHSPLHLGAYISKFEYRLLYRDFFGAALAVSREHFQQINGFSNQFFGWGGEDDEAYGRFIQHNIKINRYPQPVGRSFMFKHEADSGNPLNPVRRKLMVYTHLANYHEDGYKQTSYEVEKMENRTLYTWSLVSLKPRPKNSKCPDSCFDTDSLEKGTLHCCQMNLEYHCCLTPREETKPLLPVEESYRIVGDEYPRELLIR